MPDTPTLEAVPDSPSQEADHPAVSGGKLASVPERPRLSLVKRTVEFDEKAMASLEDWRDDLSTAIGTAERVGAQVGPTVAEFRELLGITRTALAEATEIGTARLATVEGGGAATLAEAAALVAWMLTTAKANQ